MPPFFNNKKLIILLTSLIILVALIGFSMKERKQITWPEQFVHDSVGLFQYTFSKPARYVAGFFQNLQDIRNVYEENKVLKSHLQKYAELDSNYQVLKSQNDELKKQLNISSMPDLTDSKRYVAFVIGRSFDSWNQQITVNKGLKQGIKTGMAVITAEGFIGKVTEVSQFTSVVTLVTDPSNYNQISAEVIKSGSPINGMIEGYDDKKNVLLFQKLPINANITKGDQVISSGLGGVYPKGLLIGTVTKVSTDQYGLTKVAEVKPAANFNNIEYVDIIQRLAPSASGGNGGIMKAILLFLIMFVLFLLQGTVFQVFTPEWFGYHFEAIPHLVLIGTCFISIYAGRSKGVKYAIVFGLLLDMTSSNILGVYAFCLGLTTYLFGQLARWIHLHFVSVLLLILLAVAALEIEVYGIYLLIHKATISFNELLIWRLPPTLILNGCLTILLFYPLRRFLLQLVPDQSEE